jgi:hypothetical protein
LGDVADFGESCILLSDPYYLPAGYFVPILDEHAGHAYAEKGAKYCTPQLHDSRVGRLDDEQITLLRKKMAAFWTRFVPE